MKNPIKTKIIKGVNKEENKKNNLVNLGNTMMNSNNFDIKNYLNLYEKFQTKKSRKQLNIHNSMTQFSTFNTHFKPGNVITEGNVTSTNYKTSSMDKEFVKKRKNDNLNIMTSTFIEKRNNKINDSSYFKFPSTKSSTNFVNNRNKINKKFKPNQTNNDNESFNVFKAVKEIKKSFQFPKIFNSLYCIKFSKIYFKK